MGIFKKLNGELSERSKEAVLKTVEVQASGGSNPSLSVFLSQNEIIGAVAERPKALPC